MQKVLTYVYNRGMKYLYCTSQISERDTLRFFGCAAGISILEKKGNKKEMEKEKSKKTELTTFETIHEVINYFKPNEKNEWVAREGWKDDNSCTRIFGVKTLQSYIVEMESLRKNDFVVNEKYLVDGEVVKLNDLASGEGLTAMLALLSRNVKSALICREKDLAQGGLILHYEVTFIIELYK